MDLGHLSMPVPWLQEICHIPLHRTLGSDRSGTSPVNARLVLIDLRHPTMSAPLALIVPAHHPMSTPLDLIDLGHALDPLPSSKRSGAPPMSAPSPPMDLQCPSAVDFHGWVSEAGQLYACVVSHALRIQQPNLNDIVRASICLSKLLDELPTFSKKTCL